MKPGITCLWQVNGRNRIPFEKWMELDREYIDQWSLALDFKILSQNDSGRSQRIWSILKLLKRLGWEE